MPTIIVTTVLPWIIAMMQSPLFKSLVPSDKDSIGLGKTMAYVVSYLWPPYFVIRLLMRAFELGLPNKLPPSDSGQTGRLRETC